MESGLLSLEDVLAESEKLGLEVSERTFRYYAVLGLLPRPVKRPPGSGDARVHYYEVGILDRLRQIRGLQAEGHSLKQVKKLLEVTSEHPSALVKSVAEGRFSQACQQFLQSPAGQVRETAAQFLRQLQSLVGENASQPSSRDLEACSRQLTLWHSQQQQAAPAASRLLERVKALQCEEGPARQVQSRLVEMLGRGGAPDRESLLALRRLLSKSG